MVDETKQSEVSSDGLCTLKFPMDFQSARAFLSGLDFSRVAFTLHLHIPFLAKTPSQPHEGLATSLLTWITLHSPAFKNPRLWSLSLFS